MNAAPTPAQGQPRPTTTLGGVTSLLGRVLAGAVVVAAGVAGWVAVEKYELGIPGAGNGSPAIATALPELGDGLPEARLESPAPWRRFALTYQEGSTTEHYWFDLDTWQMRIESTNETGTNAVEVEGDTGFTNLAGSDDWVEQDVQATRTITSTLMSGIGPFVLTDLVPPNTLGFTTLELEGTSRGERVYEVSVDAATLQEEHPLAYQRWVTTTRIVADSAGVYRIRVRPDGYIVRIDGANASVQWDDLAGGVVFFSPLADVAAVDTLTAPAVEPAADPAADPAGDPAVAPAPVAPEPAADAPTGD